MNWPVCVNPRVLRTCLESCRPTFRGGVGGEEGEGCGSSFGKRCLIEFVFEHGMCPACKTLVVKGERLGLWFLKGDIWLTGFSFVHVSVNFWTFWMSLLVFVIVCFWLELIVFCLSFRSHETVHTNLLETMIMKALFQNDQ